MYMPDVLNMAHSGYLKPGGDPALPDYARPEIVANPLLFPLATHGQKGILHQERERDLLKKAKSVREDLESVSLFGRTFEGSKARERYLFLRQNLQPIMEDADLITDLMMAPDIPGSIPLSEYGLASSPLGEKVREKFPNLLLDPLHAQAALAFFLARYNVSCSTTISPSFSPLLEGFSVVNAPLAFDYSHTSHFSAQNAMWSRLMNTVDNLIDLLKSEPLEEGNEEESMWDQSLIYIASDFGRSKTRPSGSTSFGSGHHFNNGHVLISPLLNGNRIYGGMDPETCLTYGFDRDTGDPRPGTLMREGDVYSVIAQALDISFEGRRDIPVMVKGV